MSESSLQSSAEYSSESSTSPSPKKKHESGSKCHSAFLIKEKKLAEVQVILLLAKKSHGRKHEKKKKILGVGHLKILKEAEKENAIYHRDQDHQKGKNTREVICDLRVNHNLVHLTIMLKNTVNSRKVDHDLQRKVLKDASNSREVDLDLVHLTMMLKNTANSRKVGHDLQRKVLKDATNSGKVDHDLQRKVLKDAGNSREVNLDLVHLTMMLKNTANSRKVAHDL